MCSSFWCLSHLHRPIIPASSHLLHHRMEESSVRLVWITATTGFIAIFLPFRFVYASTILEQLKFVNCFSPFWIVFASLSYLPTWDRAHYVIVACKAPAEPQKTIYRYYALHVMNNLIFNLAPFNFVHYIYFSLTSACNYSLIILQMFFSSISTLVQYFLWAFWSVSV